MFKREITVGDKKFELRNSIKARMTFDQILNSVSENSLGAYTKTWLMLYSYIIAHNDVDMQFDEFIDWIDDNGFTQEVMEEFTKFLNDAAEQESLRTKEKDKKSTKGSKN